MNDEIKGAQTGSSGAPSQPGSVVSLKEGTEASEMQSLAANILKEIQPTIEEIKKELIEVQKSQQSTKDKRIHDLQNKVGSLEDTTARLEKHLGLGKSFDEAKAAVKAEIQQEQFIQDFQSVKERVENLPAGTEPISLVEREATILKSLGMDANNPTVVAIQREASSPEDYVQKLEQKWWDLKNAGRGSAADIPPTTGGPPPQGPGEAEIIASYTEEVTKLKTSGQAGNVRAVQSIRKKYLEKYPELVGKI